MPLPLRLSPASRPVLARFVIVFGLTVVAWACAHDLYLIGVEPRHFTEYHRPLLPIHNHILLAIQYATVATLGPGMVFGALACAACRIGTRPAHSLAFAWRLLLPFIAAIEGAALAVGAWARSAHTDGGSLPYPDWLYPDETAGIAYSQSVNLTAYLGAFILGGLYLGTLVLLRLKR